MLPVALEYPPGIEMVSVCTVPARGGRPCEHFGGYKTINRIPLVVVAAATVVVAAAVVVMVVVVVAVVVHLKKFVIKSIDLLLYKACNLRPDVH